MSAEPVAPELGIGNCKAANSRSLALGPRVSTQVLESHTRPVLSLAVAGNRLFSGSYDYSIRVWNLSTLQREKTLTGHTDAVRALTVAGGKVFSASYDGTLKVRLLAQGLSCWDLGIAVR